MKADYLSRRPEYRLEKGGVRTTEPILKPTNIAYDDHDTSQTASESIRYMASLARICSIPPIRWSEEFLQGVRNTALKDTQYQAGIALLNNHSGNSASNANGHGNGDSDGDGNGDGNGDSDGNGNGDGNGDSDGDRVTPLGLTPMREWAKLRLRLC